MQNTPFNLPADIFELDDFLAQKEQRYDLKAGTEAQIIWQDNTPKKTDYAIVYLHGFRASHPEGDPVHKTIAQTFGCNLFLSRIDEHGIKSDYPLLHLTADKMLKSAQFAFEIGKKIGKKVILMGTSTGASLALYLASQNKYKQDISSLILYSPLVAFYGYSNLLLTNNLTRKILSVIPGQKYLITTKNMTYAEEKIWNRQYALGGVLSLGRLIQDYMTPSLFNKVTHPTFVGYYYKNKKEQDNVVSVSAIKTMTKHLGTRTENLVTSNFPEAKSHVICSSVVSKSVNSVIDNTEIFLKPLVSH